MISLTQITELLGWASLLNVGFLIFASLLLVTMKSSIASLHSKMFGIPSDELPVIYFNYLANFKTLSLIFIVAPYISLKIMAT